MAIYNKRIRFTREQLIEHYLRRDSLADFIYGIVRFIGIIIQNIYCVSSYLVLTWIILFPISWIRSDLYSRAENCLYNSLLFIVSSWSMAAGITVVETGDEYKHLIEEPVPISNISTLNNNSDGDELVTTTTTTTTITSSATKKGLVNGYQQSGKTQNEDKEKHFNLTNSDEIVTNRKLMTNNTGDQIKMLDATNGMQTMKTNNILDLDLNKDNKQEKSDCPKTTTINYNNNVNSLSVLNKNTNHKKSQVKTITTPTTDQFNISNINKSNFIISQQQPQQQLRETPRVLLLCNHISTADVPLIMQSFSTLTKQSLLWVLDAQFKPTNFGLVCSSHGDFFIAKNAFTDGSLRDQVLKHPDRNLLVLFPEGGFWRKRLEGSNRYALKNNLPMTQYVTHPRFGAFKDLIDPSVGVTHIVDTTLFYDDIKNPLSILNIALGNRKEPAILHYKVYRRDEINPTEEWLRTLWLEKDKLLQQYYEDRGRIHKRFEGTMRSAKLDWFKVCAVHLFYLLVCYLTIYRLFSATSVTMLKARDLYYSKDI